MKVNELVKILLAFPNQEAEVALLVDSKNVPVLGIWNNTNPLIIEGGKNGAHNT